MLPWDPLWRLRHVGYPVSPRGYRGLPAFASLSMAGSEGCVYRSLSRIAREITGAQWSGPLFFGLRKPGRRGKEGGER